MGSEITFGFNCNNNDTKFMWICYSFGRTLHFMQNFTSIKWQVPYQCLVFISQVWLVTWHCRRKTMHGWARTFSVNRLQKHRDFNKKKKGYARTHTNIVTVVKVHGTISPQNDKKWDLIMLKGFSTKGWSTEVEIVSSKSVNVLFSAKYWVHAQRQGFFKIGWAPLWCHEWSIARSRCNLCLILCNCIV